MIAVIGAGITGLTVGHGLQGEFRIFEREEKPGGLAGEYEAEGERFPFGGHYFHFLHKPFLLQFVERFASFTRYRRDSRVLLGGRFIPFPIQYHLALLPAKKRLLVARQMLSAEGGETEDLERFLLCHFGEELVRLFFRPFMEKFYRRPLRELMANMDKGSIPVPSRGQVKAGLQGKRFSRVGYNPVFHYPRSRSLQRFLDDYAKPLAGRISFGREVVAVDLEKKVLHTRGESLRYRALVNTAPLDQFLALCGQASRGRSLRHLSTLVVNGVLQRRRRRCHWLYLPEREYPFYRAGYYPSGREPRIYLERSLPSATVPSPKDVRQWAQRTLAAAGMIREPGEILHLQARLIPVSYVVFDHAWASTVPPLLNELRRHRVHSIGRYGSWNYTSMADDMLAALEAAQELDRR